MREKMSSGNVTRATAYVITPRMQGPLVCLNLLSLPTLLTQSFHSSFPPFPCVAMTPQCTHFFLSFTCCINHLSHTTSSLTFFNLFPLSALTFVLMPHQFSPPHTKTSTCVPSWRPLATSMPDFSIAEGLLSFHSFLTLFKYHTCSWKCLACKSRLPPQRLCCVRFRNRSTP